MKSLIAGSFLAAVVAVTSSAALACEGHGQMAQTTTTVAANADKAAPAQKADTVETKKVEEKTFKMVSIDDVEKSLAAVKEKKASFVVLDANGKETRASQGIIPTAVLLKSSSEYDLAVLPKDKATPVVFYCANEKCTASHTAAKRALQAGYSDVGVLGAGIAGWVKAGKPVEKPPVG